MGGELGVALGDYAEGLGDALVEGFAAEAVGVHYVAELVLASFGGGRIRPLTRAASLFAVRSAF